MNKVFRFFPAAPVHSESIVTAVREPFDAEVLELCIYGCEGITKYVARQIAVQSQGGDEHFSAAFADDEFAACAQLRRSPDKLFLNYIVVRPAFRSQGLASRLLAKAVTFAGAENRREIVLDVFADNAIPLAWYERLGFQRISTAAWRTIPLIPGDEVPVVLSDYPQAEACQREYGFSKFGVWAGGRSYNIGRLGTKWYRLTQPEALEAPGLTALLSRLDPGRNVFLLAADNAPISGTQARLVARSYRMEANLESMRERLARIETNDPS
ncbi:MAG: GNAT family N-acetyltransferase [Thermoguttaceae bacterium]|jgi:GNAT superfamily N-acetyltransferase